ncbi:hypothetical protein ACOME3_007804 [Neoechinorhynchus agilis]
MLTNPTKNAPITITTDASDHAVEDVLQHRISGRKPEKNYSTFDQELLVIYLAIRRFRYAVKGQLLTVFTDHQPLTFAVASLGSMVSPGTKAFRLYLGAYHEHRPCKWTQQSSGR